MGTRTGPVCRSRNSRVRTGGLAALDVGTRAGASFVVTLPLAGAKAESPERATPVALCDIGLPDIDGWVVARRLRDLPKRARILVVAVSGFGQESDRERSRRAGFDAHIVTPTRLSDLDATWAAVAHPA